MTAAVAQIVAAFNLICTGTYTSGEFLKEPSETREIAVIFRIDLDRDRWCTGDCETTAPLHKVTDTAIVFRRTGDVYSSAADDLIEKVILVNRENGKYFDRERYFLGDRLFYRMTVGVCERADFTGFPERRF